MSEQAAISIISYDFQHVMSKGLRNNILFKQGELSVDVLQANLSTFIKNMEAAFNQVTTSISNYELDEIEIKVEISAAGGVSLIGSVEAEATGGIALKFKRRQQNE